MQNLTAQPSFKRLLFSLIVVSLCVASLASAQQATNVVPTLVNFNGTVTDVNGKPLSGIVGVTFCLYKDQQGGSPLWIETQNVQADRYGHYTVALGASKSQGLPTGLFASGEARWLGVQAEGQSEQPRVMLLAVPYALKAGDAATVGGLPPSAFMLAVTGATNASSNNGNVSGGGPDAGLTAAVGGSGTTDFVPLWTAGSVLGNSILFQSGSGSTAMIGLNESTPLANLDVNGSELVRGLFESATKGNANASQGFNSNATDFEASSFNSGTSKAVLQHFEWQAEPTGNNTTNPSATLNLLFATGTNTPAETGLKLSNAGQFTFATGQTFPGTGTITGVTTATGSGLTGGGTSGNLTLSLLKTCSTNQILQWTGSAWGCATISSGGTITGVTAGTDLTGGGTSGNVTLNLDTTKVPQLNTTNAFSQAMTINTTNPFGSLQVTGSGEAIVGTMSSNDFLTAAIFGNASAGGTGSTIGVEGSSATTSGFGVFGLNNSSGTGVYGSSSTGTGVNGISSSGVAGVYGLWSSASTQGSGSINIGVWGDSSMGTGVYGSSDNAVGVLGQSNDLIGVYGSSALGFGVFGSSSEGNGVYGEANSAPGVEGYSLGVAGVNGIYYTSSTEGAGFANVAIWGDTGTPDSIALVGTVDDGNALFGKNNTVNHETLFVENDSGFTQDGTPLAARFAGPGATTYCEIYRDFNDDGTGDLYCTGSVSAAVAVDGNRTVQLYGVEAADNWFEDAGSGQLSNGSVSVAFDREFVQTVNAGVDYHVFLTPNGDCEGLYVTHKSAQGFEVHELRGGHSNIAFDYRIMARRKGFENVRMRDVSAEVRRMKVESDAQAARQEAGRQAAKARPARRIPALPRRYPSSSPQAPIHPPTMPLMAQELPKTGK